ncbi:MULTISPECIES: hypothetical protein [Tatumella]|uniref:Uncharacterized protein n=2 Tax=Tatumella ptyseos TaxID=82987 RepID=A0A085JDV9_9GAMM|nr:MULTISPECIES: hypothetical protein [Tatumella]KFD18655.1 hypothetical protein GTPT_2416 [Tatumella ptyseos ATCC 33301]SQK74627.1 Uncharacterised protein [Tatumella ptyseos]
MRPHPIRNEETSARYPDGDGIALPGQAGKRLPAIDGSVLSGRND